MRNNTTVSQTFLDLAAQAALQHTKSLLCSQGNRRIEFGDLPMLIANMANEIDQKRTNDKRTVLLYCGPSIDFVLALLASWYLGLRVAVVNPDAELGSPENLIDRCDAGILVTSEEKIEGTTCPVLHLNAAVSTSSNQDAPSPTSYVSGEDEALIVFSSGSTGTAKGIIHTFSSVNALVCNTFKLYDDPIDLFSVPLVGLGGLQMLSLCFKHGTELNWLPSISAAAVIEAVEHYRPRKVLLFPALISALLAARREKPSLLESIERCHSGGDKLSPELAASFRAAVGVPIEHAYGMAEFGPILRADVEDPNKFDLVSSSAAKIQLLGREGGSVPTGSTGELCVKSPSFMKCYLDPLDTFPVTEKAFFRTGDMFTKLNDGLLYVGRYDKNDTNDQLTKIQEELDRVAEQTIQVSVVEEGSVLFIFTTRVLSGDPDLTDRLIETATTYSHPKYERIQHVGLPALPLGPTGKINAFALQQLARDELGGADQ